MNILLYLVSFALVGIVYSLLILFLQHYTRSESSSLRTRFIVRFLLSGLVAILYLYSLRGGIHHLAAISGMLALAIGVSAEFARRRPALSAQKDVLAHYIYDYIRSPFGVVFAAYILSFFMLTPLMSVDTKDYLLRAPRSSEALLYIYLFSGLVIASFVLIIRLHGTFDRRLKTVSRIVGHIQRGVVIPSSFGLAVGLLQNFTRNTVLTNRIITFTLLACIVFAISWLVIILLPGSRNRIRREQELLIKQKRGRKRRKRRSRRR